MKIKMLAMSAFASIIIMVQSCKKNEVKTSAETVSNDTAKTVLAITGDYGTYNITNAGSSKAIEVGGDFNIGEKLDNSRSLQQWTTSHPTSDRWQKWNVINLGNGYYRIVNLFSGKSLAVPGGSNFEGLALEQYPWLNAYSQQWEITSVSSDKCKIINRATGFAITNEGGLTSNGTAITQRAYTNNASQWWRFNSILSDSYQDDAATNFFKRNSGANAFDGANSLRMPDGTDLWINNDTFYDQLNGNGMLPCIFNARNSVLRQPASHSWNPDNTPTLTYLGHPGIFVTLDPNHWFWPSGAVELGGKAYIWCNEIAPTSGGLGFTLVNQLFGQLDLSTNAVSYTNVPSLNGIAFGVGFVKGIDGYVYAYGYKPQGAPSVAANVYVARFPQNNPAAWTFWDGSSFVSSANSAVAIGAAPSNGVYITWVNSKLVMVSTQFNLGCDQGTEIYGCISNSMTGPFTSQQVIYNIPDRNQGHTPFFYTPAIHPQFNANNEFLLTYCINYYQPCILACQNGQSDPDGYRPRAVRVPFSLLGL